MQNKTVLLGMSGGVDSSVAALLLKKQGYKVIGAFMKNFSENKNPLTGECNWVEEKKMAQKLCSILKIPLITIDSEKEYMKYVIKPMLKAYKKGKTPNPDTLCNKIIKFPILWKKAKEIKADYIATGHYARITKNKSGFHLLAGKDKAKDQSYFLYDLSQSDLAHTLFLIGNYTKEQIRNIAKENNFPNWNKKGTSGVCFIGPINFKEYLKSKIKPSSGKILNEKGIAIGSHPGSQYFTIGERIGERKGIIIDNEYKINSKLYVAKKIKNNIIVVPENNPLLNQSKIIIRKLHLINPKQKLPKRLKARIRHLGSLNQGTIKKVKNNYIFTFSKPIKGVAEGQAIVIYSKDEVIGGGEISYYR